MSARSYTLNKKRQGIITVSELVNGTNIRLHETNIVRQHKMLVRLNTNGWKSATTKRAINRYFSLKGYAVSVFQKNFEWYVQILDKTVPYSDNMTIDLVNASVEYNGAA